MTFGLVDWVAL